MLSKMTNNSKMDPTFFNARVPFFLKYDENGYKKSLFILKSAKIQSVQ